MAEEEKGSTLGARRFRLPKLFAETDELEETETDDTNLSAQGSSTPQSTFAAGGTTPSYGGGTVSGGADSNEEILEYVAGMAQELLNMRAKLESIHSEIGDLNSRESAQEKVFNTLHSELSDYKKDFIYEHLKPVVRPLLFLYDSLEQFDEEVALHEPSNGQERRMGLSPRIVRENISYFRDQLVEALRVCEVTRMEAPEGTFNPKMAKAVGVVAVDADQDNTVQRVVRSGWFLNGQLLRPAEVIVGKSR